MPTHPNTPEEPVTDQLSDEVRYARRFVIRHPNRPDVHGIQLPSEIVLYDQPGIGLEAATSIQHIRDLTDNATIHWADDDPEVQR